MWNMLEAKLLRDGSTRTEETCSLVRATVIWIPKWDMGPTASCPSTDIFYSNYASSDFLLLTVWKSMPDNCMLSWGAGLFWQVKGLRLWSAWSDCMTMSLFETAPYLRTITHTSYIYQWHRACQHIVVVNGGQGEVGDAAKPSGEKQDFVTKDYIQNIDLWAKRGICYILRNPLSAAA